MLLFKKKKNAEVAILISDQIDFTTKANQETNKLTNNTNGIDSKKDITFIKIYASNIGAPKYIKSWWTLKERWTAILSLIVQDFNTPLLSKDGSSRQKKSIMKERP